MWGVIGRSPNAAFFNHQHKNIAKHQRKKDLEGRSRRTAFLIFSLKSDNIFESPYTECYNYSV